MFPHLKPSCEALIVDGYCHNSTPIHRKLYEHEVAIPQRHFLYNEARRYQHDINPALPQIHDSHYIYNLKTFHEDVREQSRIFNEQIFPGFQAEWKRQGLLGTTENNLDLAWLDNIEAIPTMANHLEKYHALHATSMQRAIFAKEPLKFRSQQICLKTSDRSFLNMASVIAARLSKCIFQTSTTDSQDEVRVFLHQMGKISRCCVIRDGTPRCKAIIDFDEYKDAQLAIWCLNGYHIGGYRIDTSWSPKGIFD